MYTKNGEIIDLLPKFDNYFDTLHTIAVKYFDLGGAMRASDKAYQTLLDEIVEGSLAPGTVLAEVEQAARLGVSRTPLREALAHLRKDGLVEPLAGRGLIVTAISIDDIVELYELRQPLEQQAARLAAQRGNPQIFSQIAAELRDSDRLISSGAEGIKAYYQLNERLDRAIEDSISSAYLVSALKGLHLHLARDGGDVRAHAGQALFQLGNALGEARVAQRFGFLRGGQRAIAVGGLSQSDGGVAQALLRLPGAFGHLLRQLPAQLQQHGQSQGHPYGARDG